MATSTILYAAALALIAITLAPHVADALCMATSEAGTDCGLGPWVGWR